MTNYTIEELEELVVTSRKEEILAWVFDNLDYSIYEPVSYTHLRAHET